MPISNSNFHLEYICFFSNLAIFQLEHFPIRSFRSENIFQISQKMALDLFPLQLLQWIQEWIPFVSLKMTLWPGEDDKWDPLSCVAIARN